MYERIYSTSYSTGFIRLITSVLTYPQSRRHLKICHNCFVLFFFLTLIIYIHIDVDECSADASPCGKNADCANNDGSYSCSCREGFDRNGLLCEGKKMVEYTNFSF